MAASVKRFYHQSRQILKIATKPNWSEVWLVIKVTAAGLGIVGLIGYIIKVVWIPLSGVVTGTGG
ncbi:MAG: protein translocase SEC61 complex subunit gamma [Candidatus Hodarchaeota archaeon]